MPLEMQNVTRFSQRFELEREEFNLNDIRLDAIWGQDIVHKKFFGMNLVIFRGLLQPDTIQEEVLI